MISRAFEKKLTSIGGSEGIIIPSAVLYAIDVKRGDKLRVWIEKIENALYQFWTGDLIPFSVI